MVKKTAKMELLRTLLSECLSAAAQEIFKIVERTITEYEEEMSCSKWVVDSHRRLLDVAESHSKDSLQMSATDVKLQSGQKQPAASVDLTVSWEPENTTLQQTEDRPDMNNTHLDCSSASEHGPSYQEILVHIEDENVKQECGQILPLKFLKVKKPFKCPVCLSGFSSKKTMLRHIKKHPEDKSLSYQCQFCDRTFCHRSDFVIHSRTHKGAKPYKCHACDKSFEQRDSLFVHRQKHTEGKPNQVFSDTVKRTPVSKFNRELDFKEEKSDIETFPLTIAPYDKSEFDQESLQPLCLYQIQTVADIDYTVPLDYIKTEPAEISDSTTSDPPLLSVSPGESGEGEADLSIKNILPRGPSGKPSKVIVQFETGTAQKPYKCPRCSKCFSLTKTLIRHVRIHTEDKPYQCQYCGRNFCQKSDLVNHIRIHTGERPYHCQECHKSFAQKGNLVVHMRKHIGEKLSVP